MVVLNLHNLLGQSQSSFLGLGFAELFCVGGVSHFRAVSLTTCETVPKKTML